ncbi:hypothetical protein ILFOPFJJ_06411 [Ensifer psoraleae]|nr:hypothetical protein [Sinorhizobium psoraleae]
MADAVETVGQAVEQEAADELVRCQRHRARGIVVAVVAPAEGHAGGVSADEAAVGDGDAMGIAAEIGEHPFGRSERRLGIGDPALLAQRTQRPRQGIAVAKRREGAEETQASGRLRRQQSLEE